MSFHLRVSSPAFVTTSVASSGTSSEPPLTAHWAATRNQSGHPPPLSLNLDLPSCLQALEDTQAYLNQLMDRCDRLPQELRQLITQKTDHLLQLQTQLLRLLGDLPGRAEELASTVQLLRSHQGILQATYRLLDELPHADHIQLLRQWEQVVQTGSQALDRLPASANITECRELFRHLLQRFDEADTRSKCNAMLRVLGSCLQRIHAEHRKATIQGNWRSGVEPARLPLSRPPQISLSAPLSLPAPEPQANAGNLVISLGASPPVKAEPSLQPGGQVPSTSCAPELAAQSATSTVESAYVFLNLMKQSSGGRPAVASGAGPQAMKGLTPSLPAPSGIGRRPAPASRETESPPPAKRGAHARPSVALDESSHEQRFPLAAQKSKARRGRPPVAKKQAAPLSTRSASTRRAAEPPPSCRDATPEDASTPLSVTVSWPPQHADGAALMPIDLSPSSSGSGTRDVPQFNLEDYINRETSSLLPDASRQPAGDHALVTPEHPGVGESPQEF